MSTTFIPRPVSTRLAVPRPALMKPTAFNLDRSGVGATAMPAGLAVTAARSIDRRPSLLERSAMGATAGEEARMIALCDTQPLMVEGVRTLLGSTSDLELRETVDSLAKALEMVRRDRKSTRLNSSH